MHKSCWQWQYIHCVRVCGGGWGATQRTQNHVSRTHRTKVLVRTRTRPEKNESPTALPLYQSVFAKIFVSFIGEKGIANLFTYSVFF